MRTIFILFFLLIFNFSYAGSGIINFVETTVELSESGEATVKYIVQYRVISGEMHGHSESLLIDDDKVFLTAGGADTNVVALNRFSGKIMWLSKGLGKRLGGV